MYTRDKLIGDAQNFACVLERKLGSEAFKRESVNAIVDAIQEICNEAMQSVIIHAYFKGINDAIQFYQEKEDVEVLRKTFYALHEELKQSK
jgi:hypothetical protein